MLSKLQLLIKLNPSRSFNLELPASARMMTLISSSQDLSRDRRLVTKLSLFWALRFSMLHADYLIVMFCFLLAANDL